MAQRDNAYAVYQQSIGALALLDALIAEEEKKAITVEDLEQVTGGKFVGADEVSEQ
jgi:hypothetical protein